MTTQLINHLSSESERVGALDTIYSQMIVSKSLSAYPNFSDWLYKKVGLGIVMNQRSIVLKYINKRLVGFVILKHHKEHKLCTFFILDNYRKQGIGHKMMTESMAFLNTFGNVPITITMSVFVVSDFNKILTNHGFVFDYVVQSEYTKDVPEYHHIRPLS